MSGPTVGAGLRNTQRAYGSVARRPYSEDVNALDLQEATLLQQDRLDLGDRSPELLPDSARGRAERHLRHEKARIPVGRGDKFHDPAEVRLPPRGEIDRALGSIPIRGLGGEIGKVEHEFGRTGRDDWHRREIGAEVRHRASIDHHRHVPALNQRG